MIDGNDACWRSRRMLCDVQTWLQGQDQMRVIKQRLMEMLPDLSVFLDVA